MQNLKYPKAQTVEGAAQEVGSGDGEENLEGDIVYNSRDSLDCFSFRLSSLERVSSGDWREENIGCRNMVDDDGIIAAKATPVTECLTVAEEFTIKSLAVLCCQYWS